MVSEPYSRAVSRAVGGRGRGTGGEGRGGLPQCGGVTCCKKWGRANEAAESRNLLWHGEGDRDTERASEWVSE